MLNNLNGVIILVLFVKVWVYVVLLLIEVSNFVIMLVDFDDS